MSLRVLRLIFGGLLATAVMPLAAQHGQLSGVAGLPVEGHEVIGEVHVRGSDHFDFKRLQTRLPEEGVLLRLGRPLDTTSICRIRETIKDQMAYKGFPDAIVTHELSPYPPGREPDAVRLFFTITEGKRASRSERRPPAPSPAERCSG
jgi:outer membrane protein assembly factor BamA